MTQLETNDLYVGQEVIYDGQHAFVSNLIGNRALVMVGSFNDFKVVPTTDLVVV